MSRATNNSSNDNEVNKKCSHYYMDLIEGLEKLNEESLKVYAGYLPPQVQHGDLVIIGEKTLRSMNIFFVNFLVTNDENQVIKQLMQCDPSQSGYCCVPVEITSKINDPIRFYDDAFNFSNYDEVDFSGIELDTIKHQSLIRRYTGGKKVATNRKCFYFLSNNDWDLTGGVFIWCDFILDDFDAGRYIKLTPEINESFLVERPLKIRDVQIQKASLEMKHKYEKKFTDTFLDMLQGAEVEVYGSMFFCPKLSMSNKCGDVLTMVFNRVEVSNQPSTKNGEEYIEKIESIVLNRLQIENVTINEISKVLDFNEEFKFTRRVLTQWGRFGGVELWCIENAAIISNDDINTYVICSPDLFI